MADVPQRIWACPIYSADLDILSWDDGVCGTFPDGCEDEHAYILATPEALAAQPEVQALIRAAKAEGEALGWNAAVRAAEETLIKRGWLQNGVRSAIRDLIKTAAAEKLERGE